MRLFGRSLLFPLVAVLATALLAGNLQALNPASAAPFVGGEIARPSAEPLTSPDVVSARVQALATGFRVQALSETTETSITFVNPDGTFTSQSTGGPARIADESAASGWRELDFTLVERGDGTFGPRSGYGEVSLSGKATAEEVAKNGAATLRGPDGKEIVVGWIGALPKPSIDAQTATYKNVRPRVDLVITVTPTGIEQFYVLRSKPKKGFHVDIPLSMDGLAVSANADGSLDLKDKKDKDRLVASIPTAYMWDARVDAASGTPAHVTTVDMTADGTSLTVAPTEGFFDDPKIEYPVTIDPTINNIAPSYDTTVRSDGGGVNYNVSYYPNELQVGTYNNGTSIAQSFLNFPTTGWAGAKVTAATLQLFEFHSYSCQASTMYVHAASSAATSTTTWNTRPALTSTYNHQAFAQGYSASCPDSWVSPNATAAADYWAAGGGATAAIGIGGSDTGTLSWKRFYSQNNPGGYWPVLNVTYNSYPGTATVPTLAPVTSSGSSLFTTSTAPTFTAKSTDPEGSNTKVTFEVHSSTVVGAATLKATCTTALVASGTDASCASATALVNGSTYYVRAQGNDGTLGSKAWSAFTAFTVSNTAPPAATITCPYADGSWTSAVPASAVACSVKVLKYVPAPANRAVSVTVQIDGGTPVATSIDSAGGTVNVSVPAASGPHSVKATTTSGAGLTTVANYAFGYGTAGISAPADTTTTIDTVRISAAAPPRGTSTVTAELKWRPANSASTTWNTAPGAVTVNAGSGSTPVTVDNFAWSTKSATVDASTGISVTLNPRLPVLLELQICFTYTPGGTKCTSDGASPTQTLRVPHAFGEGFPVAGAGDGQVALWTGELNLDATDVSVTSVGGSLSISRSHSTFAGPQDSVTSAFGSGWSASFVGEVGATSLQVVDGTTVDGTISLMSADGSALVFRHEIGGTASAPAGNYLPVGEATATTNAQLSLTGTGGSRQLLLTTIDGTKTLWKPKDGAVAVVTWVPVSVIQAGAQGTTTYTTVNGQVTRILAPVPAGVTCNSALVAGCSALEVSYASSTTASSGTPGNFVNQVSSVSYTTFDPTANAMATTLMASYKYDTTGQLVSVKNELLDTTTSYSYATYGGNTALTQIARTGYASTYFAYATSGGVKLKNVSRGGATAGEAASVQSSYVYSVPVSTNGLPDVSAAQIGKWGQLRVPTAAFAVFGADHPVTTTSASGLSTSDWAYAQLAFTDVDGYSVNNATYGAGQWLLEANLYDATGESSSNLDATAINEAVAAAASGQPFVAAEHQSMVRYNAEIPSADPAKPLIAAGSYVIDEWSAPSWSVLANGTTAWVRKHTHYDYDQGAPHSGINPSSGKPYVLTTKVTVGSTTTANVSVDPAVALAADIETLSIAQYGYDSIDGAAADDPTSGWVVGTATVATTVMPNPADNIVRKARFDALGKVVESREPLSAGGDAGAMLTIMYTAGANTLDAACGNKPAWAGLVCWVGPAAAPLAGSDIADKRVTLYSKWLAVGVVVETSGSGASLATRTTTTTFLSDGRPREQSVSSTGLSGSASVAMQRAVYDATTKASSGVQTLDATGSPVADVTWESDLWGRQTSFINVQGEETTTVYRSPGTAGAGQVATVTDPTGSSTYSYDGTDADGKSEHRGLPTGLTVSDVGAFSAAFNATGALVTQLMPAGLRQDLEYTDQGVLSSLLYSGDVTSGGTTATGVWLSFSRDYDGAGRVAREWTPEGGTAISSTGYSNAYTYDRAGRLTRVVSAPSTGAASICATRDYVFDKQGNRTSRTDAGASGGCPTSGGVTTTWAYDAFSRQLTAANGAGSYEYDALGRQTLLPAADAPRAANGDITIGYFDTDAVASIAQGGVVEEFTLDPLGRRSTQTTTGGSAAGTLVRHYGDNSDNPAWAVQSNGTNSATTRYLSGLGAGVSATSTLEAATTTSALVLVDPAGSVVSTVEIPSTGHASTITGFAAADEFGADGSYVDTGVIQYGWLGAGQRAVNDFGLTLMGARLYNPITARFTSVDPIRGANENAYIYPNDPINLSDISGKNPIALVGIAAILKAIIEVILLFLIGVLILVALIWVLTELVKAIVAWAKSHPADKSRPQNFGKSFKTKAAAVGAAMQFLKRFNDNHGKGWRAVFRGPHGPNWDHVHVEIWYNTRLMNVVHFYYK